MGSKGVGNKLHGLQNNLKELHFSSGDKKRKGNMMGFNYLEGCLMEESKDLFSTLLGPV